MANANFQPMTADELREYVKSHVEQDYLLIDVRELEEYTAGHIPGARLMALTDLEARLPEIPGDRDLIFYCRSGIRSAVAASLYERRADQHRKVYNLVDGILAWEGKTLSGFPRVQVFFESLDRPRVLFKAMELEKGALLFYQHVLDRHGAEPIAPVFADLVTAERAHAQVVYRVWSRTQPDTPPFDQVFDAMRGDVLEGGRKVADLVARLETESASCLDLIEIAMNIEHEAFDLYRAMAEQSQDTATRNFFLGLSQAEKGHLRALVRGIELCPE